jgi:hypothetical protein
LDFGFSPADVGEPPASGSGGLTCQISDSTSAPPFAAPPFTGGGKRKAPPRGQGRFKFMQDAWNCIRLVFDGEERGFTYLASAPVGRGRPR